MKACNLIVRFLHLLLAELAMLRWPSGRLVFGLALGGFAFAYEPQDVLDIRNIALAPNKQSNFLTPVAAASYIYRPRNAGSYNADHLPTFETDDDKANKGHQWLTQQNRVQEDTSFDGTFDVDAFYAGWALFFILGSETVTGAGPYVHTLKFLQSTNQAPVTSVLFQETNDVVFQFPDLAISSLTFTGKEAGILQSQLKMIGSGKKVDGAVTFPALATQNYIFGSDTDIKIGPSAPDVLGDPNQAFTLTTVVSGAQAQHTAFYKVTYVNAAGETLASAEISILVPASSVSKITVPATLPAGVTGVNIYASNATGTETKQGGTLAAGGNFQEPPTGFTAGGALPTATTALSSIKERVIDWQVTLTADMVPNRAPGGSLWATFMKVLKQRANLMMTVKATSADDMRTLAENDTAREVQIIANSGAAAQVTFQFPCALLKNTKAEVVNREMVWKMSAGDKDVKKLAPQEIFQAVVTNNQSAYGVGA